MLDMTFLYTHKHHFHKTNDSYYSELCNYIMLVYWKDTYVLVSAEKRECTQ